MEFKSYVGILVDVLIGEIFLFDNNVLVWDVIMVVYLREY